MERTTRYCATSVSTLRCRTSGTMTAFSATSDHDRAAVRFLLPHLSVAELHQYKYLRCGVYGQSRRLVPTTRGRRSNSCALDRALAALLYGECAGSRLRRAWASSLLLRVPETTEKTAPPHRGSLYAHEELGPRPPSVPHVAQPRDPPARRPARRAAARRPPRRCSSCKIDVRRVNCVILLALGTKSRGVLALMNCK